MLMLKQIIIFILLTLVYSSCRKNKIKIAHIYGHVADAATGTPRKDFKILISGEFTDFTETLFTDKNGDYFLDVEYSDGKKTKLKSETVVIVEAAGDASPYNSASSWAEEEYYHFYNSKRYEYRKINNSIEVNFECACPAFYTPKFVCMGAIPADSITYRISNNLPDYQGNFGNLLNFSVYPDFSLILISGVDNYLDFFVYTSGAKVTYRDTIHPSCRENLKATINYY